MASQVFSITELARTGAAKLVPTSSVFRWDAKTHTAPIASISPPLRVATNRSEPPGSNQVVEQVLTCTWQPFKVQGHWDDKWAGQGFAKKTFEEFRRMVARTPLVRLELSFISMTGLITEFIPTYHDDHFMEWEFQFSPHAFSDDTTLGFAIPPTIRPTREHVALGDELIKLIDEKMLDAKLLPMRGTTVAELLAENASLNSDIFALLAAVDIPDLDAVRQLRHMAARFRSIRDAAQRLVVGLSKVRSDVELAFDDAVLTLRFDIWVKDTASLARQLVLRSHEAERDCTAQADARPKSLHRPYAGESLFQISLKYYGTPGEWRRIYDANRLSSLLLTGEEELIIPERSA